MMTLRIQASWPYSTTMTSSSLQCSQPYRPPLWKDPSIRLSVHRHVYNQPILFLLSKLRVRQERHVATSQLEEPNVKWYKIMNYR